MAEKSGRLERWGANIISVALSTTLLYTCVAATFRSVDRPIRESPAYNEIRSLPDAAQCTDIKTYSIGLGTDREDTSFFKHAVDEANIGLSKACTRLSLDEIVKLRVPADQVPIDEPAKVWRSFDRNHNHYFLWLNRSIEPARDRMPADVELHSRPLKGITQINNLDNIFDLPGILVSEACRAGSLNPNLRIERGQMRRYPFGCNTNLRLTDDLLNTATEPDLQPLYDEPRTITATVFLEGVPQEKADEWLSKLSANFQQRYNITIVPENHEQYEGRHGIEYNLIKMRTKAPSDIAVLLTDKRYAPKANDIPKRAASVDGGCYGDYGSLYVTVSDDETTLIVLEHETTHLFVSDHNYRADGLMQENIGKSNIKESNVVTGAEHRIVLENKFKNWKLTKEAIEYIHHMEAKDAQLQDQRH
jgi:hypothetical protein